MSVDELQDPDVRALVEAARSEPAAPSDAKARVAARLALSVLGGGGSTGGGGGADGAGVARRGARAAASWPASYKGAIVGAFAAGALIGGVAVALRAPGERVVYVDRAVAVAAPLASVVSAPPLAQEAPPADGVDAGALGAVTPPAKGAAPSEASSLAAEQAMLDTARVALGRNDGAAALRAADQHKRRFPDGRLAEEREAIAIQALVLLDRRDDAHLRAARFAQAYPDSALAPAIDEALGRTR